ncbi:hypothetical protein Vretifemale_14147 [Volvox reticuliferus]|uniref:Chitin-binding type-2 domain-containing protein n=1 Tax=Volvox reticuliferus TaxID=1737510 RepID=A0A8J4CQN8_9CHLO|nr:hypothetical protein Vretifemale_14147 [Volvox reticuliferus]
MMSIGCWVWAAGLKAGKTNGMGRRPYKLIACWVILGWMALVPSIAQGASSCPEPSCSPTSTGSPVLLPSPCNCSQYYICHWGTPTSMDCPAGMHFNAKSMNCDFPDAAGCTAIIGVVTPDEIPQSHLRSLKVALPACPADPAINCVPVAPGGSTVYIPHPCDCNKFYACDLSVSFRTGHSSI